MIHKLADDLLGPASMSSKISRFYELYKATLIFSLFVIPYMLVNIVFKPHIVTMPIYLVVGIWLYPNFMALLHVMTKIYAETTETKLKTYWVQYVQALRRFMAPGLKFGAISNVVIGIYLLEVGVIVSHKQIAFMIVPFIVLGTLAVSALIHYVMITVRSPKTPWRLRMRLAAFIGWKYLLKSVVVAFLFVAWLSFANQAAFLNVMIVSEVIWWLLYRSLNASMNKVAATV